MFNQRKQLTTVRKPECRVAMLVDDEFSRTTVCCDGIWWTGTDTRRSASSASNFQITIKTTTATIHEIFL